MANAISNLWKEDDGPESFARLADSMGTCGSFCRSRVEFVRRVVIYEEACPLVMEAAAESEPASALVRLVDVVVADGNWEMMSAIHVRLADMAAGSRLQLKLLSVHARGSCPFSTVHLVTSSTSHLSLCCLCRVPQSGGCREPLGRHIQSRLALLGEVLWSE